MKKPELKIDLSKFEIESRNTNWQKAVFSALLVSLAVFLAATLYLFIRPLSQDIKNGVDAEISAQAINFDFKTLETLKSRQVPATSTAAPSGKNPFTPY